MKRRTATVGALMLVLALYLYFDPSTSATLTSNLGSVGTETVFNRNLVIAVAPQNYSYFETKLDQGESISVTLSANPGNVDVLLMNQGNFSLWGIGNRGSYSTYPQSALRVSNYTFAFTNNEAAQTFFMVLVAHSPNQITDALVHAVATRPSQAGTLLLPFALGGMGLVVLAYASRGGRKKPREGDLKPVEAPAPEAETATSPKGAVFCRHCGAALRAGSTFCPSCERSQT